MWDRSSLQEFYTACQVSQHTFVDAIPWATAKADQARREAEALPEPPSDDTEASQGEIQSNMANGERRPAGETKEEQLLAVMLTANQDLIDAFRIYDCRF